MAIFMVHLPRAASTPSRLRRVASPDHAARDTKDSIHEQCTCQAETTEPGRRAALLGCDPESCAV